VTGSIRDLSRRFRALLHLDDPPWRIALALAVGVFISCTPFYFFQTLLALLVATIFRLNKAATIAGTWLNLPWLQPLVYAAALKVGTLLVPTDEPHPGQAISAFLAEPRSFSRGELMRLAESLSVAFLVGTTLIGVAAAALTYAVAVRVITARRARGRERVERRRRAA
jgi:uncharacterized protein